MTNSSPRMRAMTFLQEGNKRCYYGSYLSLDKLLDIQKPLSIGCDNEGGPAHDELLFIIVHQTYELWFKLILYELESIQQIFDQAFISDDEMSTVVHRLSRVHKIQCSQLVPAMDVLETMTPMDFLEFRDFLVPASGFQSSQFRAIETLLGLSLKNRKYGSEEWLKSKIDDEDMQKVYRLEEKDSLLLLTEKWLERLPLIEGFNWLEEYQAAVHEMLRSDETVIRDTFSEDSSELETELNNLKATQCSFQSLFELEKHQEMVRRGVRSMSQKATLNAIFITLYRDKPPFHQPFRLLQLLCDVDEAFTSWRYRHAQVARRIIGGKMGTGATAGVEYLNKAAASNRVFGDLVNLSTFLIPRQMVPKLPSTLIENLTFKT